MALKLDMSKAYNMAEWVSLEKLMERIGFCSRWIGLIMECVRTVSYSIIVNGELKGMINPSRGIRQGNSLSPFLFLLCIECLHRLIKRGARSKEINDFSLCKRGSKLTHLFFLQTIAFFLVGLIHKSVEMLSNFFRSTKLFLEVALLFSKSTQEHARQEIMTVLGVQEIKFNEKYLGLLAWVDRGKKASFSYIKERVWRKFHGWEDKLLSQASREVLIKAVM